MFWCMVLLVYLMDKHSLFLFGETITATPGQNVSLPCNNDNMNDGNVVRWFAHNDYISTGKIISDNSSLALVATYFTIPGEGADYSLFIMIPDDINIWPYLDEDYECKLTSSGDDTLLNTVTLHIYQSLPKCTSLHINDTSSIASCSYQIHMESLMWISNGSILTTINCLPSDVCTLNYTYDPADIVPHGLTCVVKVSGMISTTKSCSIHEVFFTLSPEETEMDQPSHRSTTGAYFTETTSNFETSSIKNTPPTMFQSSPITTKETISTTIKTTYEQINSTTKNPDVPIQLIAIMSVAFVIILLLIIVIIYYVRRRSQYKQNSSFKSAPQDDHEYVEVDFKVNPTTKGEHHEIMENSKDSVMEENQIYESAGMNGKQINDDGNVANKLKKEIKNVIVDGEYTKRIYKTREQVLEQSEALKRSALENSNEDGTNDGIVYHENEAYKSLDDINVNNDKLDLKESDKKGTKIPAYVHYEVLELE